LKRAERAGVPTLYFPLKPYKEAGRTREEYDRDLAEQVARWSPDLIVLAGWMHILSPAFLDRFPGPVIATARVPILPDDTLETFEQRMHAAEHRLIVDATRKALEVLHA